MNILSINPLIDPAHFLTNLVFFFFIAVFPLCALALGWYTKNRIAAVITGIFLPLFMVITFFLQSSPPPSEAWVNESAVYYAGLLLTGGLAGFLASYHERTRLLMALGCAILFSLIFLSGIR